MSKNRVLIFDTTLRDGEQCPGASMNLREKLAVARQLSRLKVDVIEAGFPVISDGDFTAGLFARLGVEATRGSTSRGSALAARGMLAAARAGRDLGITLDGTRGPAKVVQPGATWVARAAGCALLPVGFACSRYRRLGSWDRMVIPLPFARGAFVYGEHLYVPRDTPRDQLAEADQELARRVEEVTKRAETMLLT